MSAVTTPAGPKSLKSCALTIQKASNFAACFRVLTKHPVLVRKTVLGRRINFGLLHFSGTYSSCSAPPWCGAARGSFRMDPRRAALSAAVFRATHRSRPFTDRVRVTSQSCACKFCPLLLPHPSEALHRGLVLAFLGPCWCCSTSSCRYKTYQATRAPTALQNPLASRVREDIPLGAGERGASGFGDNACSSSRLSKTMR